MALVSLFCTTLLMLLWRGVRRGSHFCYAKVLMSCDSSKSSVANQSKLIPKRHFTVAFFVAVCVCIFVQIDCFFYIEYRDFLDEGYKDRLYQCVITEKTQNSEEAAEPSYTVINCYGVHCILEKPKIPKATNFFRVVHPQLPADVQIRFYYMEGGRLETSQLPKSMYIAPGSMYRVSAPTYSEKTHFPYEFTSAPQALEQSLKTCKRMIPIPVPNEEDAQKLADYLSFTQLKMLKGGYLMNQLCTFKETLARILEAFNEACTSRSYGRRKKSAKTPLQILELKKQLVLSTMVLVTKIVDPCFLAGGYHMNKATSADFCTTYCQFLTITPKILNLKSSLDCITLMTGKCWADSCHCTQPWFWGIGKTEVKIFAFHNAVRKNYLTDTKYKEFLSFIKGTDVSTSFTRQPSILPTY